jgi:signal peptidase I
MKQKNKSHGPPGKESPPLKPEKVIEKRKRNLEMRRDFLKLIRKVICIIFVVWVMLGFIFGIGIVNGEGMYPRMRDGDLVVFFRINSEFNVGDIVTFRIDGKRQYARIAARGGDVVDLTEDGQLVVNGNIQEEEVFFATSKEGRQTSFPCTVENDAVFVLCDNRTKARDSRDYGTVRTSDIDGKVISLLRRRGL